MRNRSLFTAVFFNYIGYYVYLLLLFYIGFSGFSLGFSVLLRFIILCCLIVLFARSGKLKANAATYLFLFFSIFYLARIIIDALKGLPYYVSTPKLILYYLSFDMIPFLLIYHIKFRATDFITIRKALLLSGFFFSILALYFFRNYIGTVGRLTTETAETDMLSPLALSYCSSLSIGIAASYWMENKTMLRDRVYLSLIILLSAAPFFLGSSRGSLVALVFPFLLILVSKKNLISNIRLIFITLIALIIIVYLSEFFGSNLIDRFTQTTSDIQEGNDAAIRTLMWKNAFNQFTENPILGDRLKVDGFDIYPHNILIEILQCTGFMGFIPFFILTIITFIKSIKIFRHNPAYSWVAVLFIQCFTQNMFSGGIFSASWLMMSMALVFAFDRMFHQNPKTNYQPVNLNS